MLLIRQIRPQFSRYLQRSLAYNTDPPTTRKKMNQIHKEQLLYVKRNAKITIRSDIYMKIRAADVLQYPEGTALCAELYGGPEKNLSADMKIKVSENEHEVEVVCSKLTDDSDCYCLLAVPIMADLNIDTKDAISVENIYNQELKVTAKKKIKTKDIKSAWIELVSLSGNIICSGTFLADLSVVQTKGCGNVTLDKAQGNILECKTEAGSIKTNSCYMDSSKFTTETGSMNLWNVHKKAQVLVNKKGDLNVCGFHGTLCIRSNGGKMNLQLSEICDENLILAGDIEESIVNISDSIEERSRIEITATEVKLDGSLSHLSDSLSVDKMFFRKEGDCKGNNKLMICAKGAVKLGKLSWVESMKIAMGIKDK